jgi:hypothetical protein
MFTSLLVVAVAGATGAPTPDSPVVRYDGHQVVRCHVAKPSSLAAVSLLDDIANRNPSLDWWSPPVSSRALWHPPLA